MTTLLIDNSNTRTKFALSTSAGLLPWRGVVETREITVPAVQRVLVGQRFDAAVLCSVVPAKAEVLEAALSCPVHRVSSASVLGMDISYPRPQEIGADRLANGVAAFAQYGAPCIVIDSGTAVTFDVIEPPGLYAGGVIAPGLNLLTDYFAEKTALLPKISLTEPESFIGRSTTDAMNIGAIAGFRGLIREILTGLIEELPSPPTVIATGGDAALLFKGIRRINHVNPDLTLDGIRRIGELNL